MEELRLCVFGDSIGKGVVLSESNRYEIMRPSISKLSDGTNVVFKNNASFGSTVSKMLSKLEYHKDELKNYDNILIEVGGNDCDFDWQQVSEQPECEHSCKTPINRFSELYEKAINLIKSSGGKPVAVTLPPVVAERYFKRISKDKSQGNILKWLGGVNTIYRWHEMYNLCIVMLASRLNIPLIDIRSSFLKNHHYEDFIGGDGIHPNREGYELIYQTVAVHYRLNSRN